MGKGDKNPREGRSRSTGVKNATKQEALLDEARKAR